MSDFGWIKSLPDAVLIHQYSKWDEKRMKFVLESGIPRVDREYLDLFLHALRTEIAGRLILELKQQADSGRLLR